VIARIDLVGRAAFGLLCIGGMAGVSVPVLAAAGAAGGIVFAAQGDGTKALVVWLAAWAAAAFAVALFVAIAYAAWPLASDWITEWPGYAMGFGVGGAGLALMAALIFLTPVPLYAAVPLPVVATFTVGVVVPGRFLGLRRPGLRTMERPRLGRRRWGSR
jgi:hypothetical protein